MRTLALKTSIWNAIGYAVTVGIPTIVDPLLEHAVKYGARIYPLGYWILLPSIVVLGLTYFVCVKKWSASTKRSLVFIILLIFSWATLGNFLPEFPHLWILLVPIWFGSLVALTVYVGNYWIDYSFIQDGQIDRSVKMLRISLEHDSWFRILIGTIGGYVLILIYIFMFMKDFIPTISTWQTEQFFLMIAYSVTIALNILLFLTGFVWEMLVKIKKIRDSLLNVR